MLKHEWDEYIRQLQASEDRRELKKKGIPEMMDKLLEMI